MIRRKYVPLRIAQPGMMIDQAIIDRAGRVLIARRTRLEDFHIDALKKMGVTGIYTCEGTEDIKPAEADKTQSLPEPLQKKYDQVKVKDPAKVQISESVRSRVAQGVQYLYQDTQSADFTNASRSGTDSEKNGKNNGKNSVRHRRRRTVLEIRPVSGHPERLRLWR